MWIKRQVVMLPTEKAEKCLMLRHKHLSYQPIYLTQKWLKYNDATSYHLYILSDEEIKEGDYCIEFIKGIPTNVLQIKGHDFKRCLHNYEKLKKIIATTDKLILQLNKSAFDRSEDRYLPQPSQSFIQKYVEEYNKGNIITEVMVEYERYLDQMSFDYEVYVNKLKINPKDNTISIRKIKDSWNRGEVFNLMFQAWMQGEKNSLQSQEFITKWIEENL
jgi:hypothetical protein